VLEAVPIAPQRRKADETVVATRFQTLDAIPNASKGRGYLFPPCTRGEGGDYSKNCRMQQDRRSRGDPWACC